MGAPFWRLFSAYSVNSVGDEFYAIALPLALLANGFPEYTVTFLFGVLTAATVIGGFSVGFLADRWPTRELLVGTYLLSGAVLAGGAALIGAGVGGFRVALAVAAVLGVLAAVSAAGADAGVPRTVAGDDRITRGYSLVEGARQTATVAGPAMAGVVAVVSSVAGVFLLNAASFVAAAGLMVTGRGAGRDSAVDEPAPAPQRPWRMLAAGYAGIVGNPALRLGIALSFTLNVALGAEQPMYLSRLVDELGLSPVGASLVMTAAGGVSIVAALAVAAVRTSVPARTGMIASSAVTAVTAVGVGVTRGVVLSAACYCLLVMSTVYYNVSWRTYRQGLVEPGLLGRISASCRSIAYLGVVLGVAAAGSLQRAGMTTGAVFVGGGLVALAGTAFVGWALRRPSPHGRTGP